jgi:hypothetical protein
VFFFNTITQERSWDPPMDIECGAGDIVAAVRVVVSLSLSQPLTDGHCDVGGYRR